MQERQMRNGDGRMVTLLAPAGTGLIEHLRAMRLGWEEAGYRVRGVALSWPQTRPLAESTGIRWQTLISLENEIEPDLRDGWPGLPLTDQDVLVMDEAGISRRRKTKLVTAVREAGAQLVTVRDPHQLPAVGSV